MLASRYEAVYYNETMRPKEPLKIPPAYDPAIEKHFQKQAEIFQLNYTCDDCMNFDKHGQKCVEFYPTEALRTPGHPVRLKENDWLFCKCFEMN
jgi:hypothetical protein